MRKNRTYRAKSVKNIEWEEVVKDRERQAIHVGVDVGKRAVLAVVRWNGDEFERPWLYFAALRWIRNGPGRRWYLRKRAQTRKERSVH